MKTLILLSFIFSTTAMAGVEWECIYQRTEEGRKKPERHRFILSQGYAEKEADFRGHGYKAKIVNDALIVEAREGSSTKVSTLSVQDPYGPQRDPKIPGVKLEFPKTVIEVRCR